MGCTRTPLRLLVAATLVNIVLIIEVPQIESQGVGSETHVRKWVMLDEINTEPHAHRHVQFRLHIQNPVQPDRACQVGRGIDC